MVSYRAWFDDRPGRLAVPAAAQRTGPDHRHDPSPPSLSSCGASPRSDPATTPRPPHAIVRCPCPPRWRPRRPLGNPLRTPRPEIHDAAPPSPTVVANSEMESIAPAALSSFQVRVLNASGQRGAARSVSDDLTAQDSPRPPTPRTPTIRVYVGRDLTIVAQIRFGPAGKSGAAAVWLAIPCAQLVDDGRCGTVVDVALGTYYESRELSQDAAALEALRLANPGDPSTGADPGLVSAVH